LSASETLTVKVESFVMSKEQMSKAGWLDRRRERKRAKLLRTGDSPEKTAEGRTSRAPTPGEAADRVGWAGFFGGF
jgi:hypothetical protein